jgi:CRP-like cAMP-binding protein
MPTSVREVRAEARRRASAGDPAGALHLYDHLLAANPSDYGCRLRIADTLAQLGRRDDAVAVHSSLADHNMRSGHPLPAIVACKRIDALGGSSAALVDRLAALYGQGSPTLGGFTARQAPADLDAEVPEPEPGASEPPEAIGDRARDRALDLSASVQYPEHFLPVPFLSELPPPLFGAVVGALAARQLLPGDLVVREGEIGTSFYLVAGGEASVYATDGIGTRTERARIHENAVFGEMALLTSQPRTASVEAVDEMEVLELTGDALATLTRGRPQLLEVLSRFARERLLKNLLATSPLFRPFTRKQQLDLIRHFEGHEVSPGTEIIREGEPGLGLYVVLSGEVEVSKRAAADGGGDAGSAGGEEVLLARLGAGDLCGEMSLVADRPTSATVRATGPSTILFLAREYFQRLIEALPDLRRYFEALAERRDLEIRLVLGDGSEDGGSESKKDEDQDGDEPPPVLL